MNSKQQDKPAEAPFDFEAHGCHCPAALHVVPGAAEEGNGHCRGHDHAHDGHRDPDDRGPDHDSAIDRGHDHSHDHAHGGPHVHVDVSDRKRLVGALLLTCSMMVIEIAGGLISGSLALLSDAGHMLTDAAALFLAFLALRFAARPADGRRTYGFFRFEILSAFINALTLILMALVITWEAIQRLQSPEPIRAGVMMAVAAAGLVVNLGGMALLSKSESLNVRGAFLHVLGDTLSSVGVLVAAAVTWWTGWTFLDPVISIAIAAVIAFGAVKLLRQAIHILIEGAPAHAPFCEVVQALLGIEGVTGVHDLHIWTIAQNRHALSAHVELSPACTLDDCGRILAEARALLDRRFHLAHSTLQLEVTASPAAASKAAHPAVAAAAAAAAGA